MFYSHEILTDRKHGVATIWLVATLGSKSSLKKVTRKAIMDVDVPQACTTITNPSAPIALRLQGNLLYGISKVFSQQCAYMLTDTQNLQDKMRGISMLFQDLEIDPDVVTTRPEQLNLQTDPGFTIELDLGFDLSGFDLSSSFSEPSDFMSPHTLPSSRTSLVSEEQFLEELAPLDESSLQNSDAAYVTTPDNIVSGLPLNGNSERDYMPSVEQEEVAIDQYESFHIEEDGNLVLGPASIQADSGQSLMSNHLDFDLRLEEQAVDIEVEDPAPDFEEGTPYASQGDPVFFADDDGEPFEDVRVHDGTKGSMPPEVPQNHQEVQSSIEQVDTNAQGRETEIITETAHQTKKMTRHLQADNPAELPNQVLTQWSVHYIDSMQSAMIQNASKISIAQARRNANYWVLDQGIGGVDADFRHDQEEHPLAVFSGQSLLDMFQDHSIGATSNERKRSSSAMAEGPDDYDDSRRVRTRSEDQQPEEHEDDEIHIVFNDNDNRNATPVEQDQDLHQDFEPQVGREEQPPMTDHPDSMPWNQIVYASSRQTSRHGSTRPGPSRGISTEPGSSVKGHARFDFIPSSYGSKRISRLIQESPLEQRQRLLQQASTISPNAIHLGHGYGQPSSAGDGDNHFDLGPDDAVMDDIEDTALLDHRLAVGLDEAKNFELLDSPDRSSSQWLAATLEQEAFNFLAFLQTTIAQRQADMIITDEAMGTGTEQNQGNDIEVTFEELLPPDRNSEIVAAQGLLHVLSLATKGLIEIHQDEGYGDIHMSLVSVNDQSIAEADQTDQ